MFSPISKILANSQQPTFLQTVAAPKAAAAAPKRSVTAFSPAKVYDLTYYLKGAFAGGICCSVTHGALTPVDVVKTRMQLEPTKYTGMISGFQKVIAEEGVGALATGLGPTVMGYFIQGWFKFGGVEFFKVNQAQYFGVERAWELRFPIYLASAACAEFIADVFLCPLEAVRIKLVANPSYADGLLAAAPKVMKEEGFVRGFYSGFVPILFKQIPYTMAKFVVQGWAAEKIAAAAGIDMKAAPESSKLAVSLSSGVVAGVGAAIISHPADTLLSLVNKKGAGGTGSMGSRLANIAAEVGIVKLCLTGLPARCVMIGSLTAGQFGIFDIVMNAVGASKFSFTDPATLKK